MKLSRLYVLAITIGALLSLSLNTFAQDKKELKKAQERVDSASEVMREIMKIPDKSIPKEILDKAEAIVVFPGVLKAAFIVGGQGGKGVAVRKTKNGWSAPAFLNVGGGSLGFQIGGEKIDYVLVVLNDGGLKGLLEDKFEFGGEASVAAGPVGRTAAATTNATLDAGILTYSRSQGAFAGVSLKGAVISQDEDMNQAIYKKSARELLFDPVTPWTAAPKSLQKFPKTVAMFAK
ncbi:MAG: lipid-binding SYLF domain-containing protein [Acidobacteria bacterium]|nr:lipid-binding SYLF domain-containing protein [Acidobacteriota bacterium]